jgi:hypothetical protein
VQPQVGFDAGTFNSGLGGFCCISRPWHWPAFGLFDSLYTLLVPSAASSRSLAAVGEVQVDAARALLQAELKGAFLGTAGAAAGLYEADWGCGCAFVILLCQGHSTGQPWIQIETCITGMVCCLDAARPMVEATTKKHIFDFYWCSCRSLWEPF